MTFYPALAFVAAQLGSGCAPLSAAPFGGMLGLVVCAHTGTNQKKLGVDRVDLVFPKIPDGIQTVLLE